MCAAWDTDSRSRESNQLACRSRWLAVPRSSGEIHQGAVASCGMPALLNVEVSARTHACALNVSAAQRVDLVAGFTADGLRRRDRVLLIGMSEQDTRRLLAALAGAGIDTATARAGDQLAIVRTEDLLAPFRRTRTSFIASVTDEIERSLQGGSPALRLSGTFHASGVAPFEADLHGLVRDLPLTVFCPYLAGQLSPEKLVEVAVLHDAEVRVEDGTAAEALESAAPLIADDDVTDLTDLRHSVYLAVLRTALPRATATDFLTAFNEVALNALQHGRPPVAVRLWTTYSRVLCSVTDAGPGFRQSPDQRTTGAGLWVAQRFCDQLTVSSPPAGGCTVRLSTGR